MKTLILTLSFLVSFLGATVYAQQNNSAGFASFMERFAQDTSFQKQHTVFPLEYRTWVAGEDDSVELLLMQDKDWQPMNFSAKPGIKRHGGDYGDFIEHFVVGAKSATIQMRGVDNGIYTDFIFERRHKTWYLIRIEDHST